MTTHENLIICYFFLYRWGLILIPGILIVFEMNNQYNETRCSTKKCGFANRRPAKGAKKKFDGKLMLEAIYHVTITPWGSPITSRYVEKNLTAPLPWQPAIT